MIQSMNIKFKMIRISNEIWLTLSYTKRTFITTLTEDFITMIDIEKLVKLKYPGAGEEDVIYKVVNFNEVTNRCYISPINLDFTIPPQELVSVDDIVNI